MTTRVRRLALVGVDCGTPELLFERFADDMPTLTKLRERSLWGPLRSIDPPISIPAWMCMLSGRTPGELGVYGMRNRRDYSYGGLGFATSKAFTAPRLWELLGAAGGDSIVLSVPGTYPPTPLRGWMVSCFLTPSTDVQFTHPPELGCEVQAVTGGYTIDIPGFRDGEPVAQRMFDMTEQRFALATHMATTRSWDLLAFVDVAPDRLHHSFWKYCDPAHPKYEPGNRHEHVFRDYYRAFDAHLARFLEVLPDDTAVLVVSDHGGQPMVGGFCFNEWLQREGLLTLVERPAGPTPLAKAKIDWSRTAAWGEGGYYGRLFLNVEGREPHGTVPAGEYETVRQLLVDKLEALTDHRGQPMGTRALRPQELYPQVNGVAPDLIVYFGDLRWRSVGSVGPVGPVGLDGGLYAFENDTGPDDCNHSDRAVFVLAGDGLARGRRDDLSMMDVAPTLQSLLGIERQVGQRGRVLA
jgi:predicted AlkP superfamily phosphohydrolase/phosphomutase